MQHNARVGIFRVNGASGLFLLALFWTWWGGGRKVVSSRGVCIGASGCA